MVRMVRVLALCTLMLATLLPVATAWATHAPVVAAAPAETDSPVEEAADAEAAVPEAPVETPAEPPAVVDEPDEAAEAPAAPVVETTEPPTDAGHEPDEPDEPGGAATDDQPGDEPIRDPAAPEGPDTVTDADVVEGGDADEPSAAAQAVGPAVAPDDVVVVEFDAQGFCDLLVGQDGPAEEASVQVAPAVAQAASLPYADLVAQVDAVLARYPDAMLVSATYDGSSLIVVLIPDVSVCEGFDGGELPVPVDDLADVEVVVEVLPDEDVCLLLDEEFGEEALTAPSIEDLLAALEDEELAEIVEARFGPDLSADELAELLHFAGALDPVLAETPGGWVDVTYDGEVLFVFVTPDPATVDCGEDPVVAQPISNPVPPARGGGGRTAAPAAAASGGRLAQTGFDTTEQAAAGLVAILLGVVLLRRGRYRGLHAAG